MYKNRLFAILITLFISAAAIAQTGVRGTVVDSKTGEPLIGVTVSVKNTTTGTITDDNGEYILNLKPGKYTLSTSYISFVSLDITDVEVKRGEYTKLDVPMQEDVKALNAVVVVAMARLTSEVGLLTNIRNSTSIATGISSQQISRTQDSNASAVIRRVPGISLIDNKFVMVRGLSQRYNNVWINKTGVPSSEADSRAFSYDMIPSSQLDNLVVVKSAAPELPADFSGGFMQIQTKSIPNQNTFQVMVGTAVNDQTHFRDSYKSKLSGTDFLGFDGGLRSASIKMMDRLDNSDATAVTNFTKTGFNNDWSVKSYKPLPDLRLGAVLNRYKVKDGKTYAMLASLNYTSGDKTYKDMKNARYGIYDRVNDKPEYSYNYTDQRYERNVRVGAMLNLTYIASADDRYEFRNIFNQLGNDRYTFREGFQNISSLYNQEKTEYYYSSRMTYNGQFSGNHQRGTNIFDWVAGYSYANRDMPDRRIIERRENDYVSDPNYGKMMVDQQEIQREFNFLKEHIASVNLNYKKNLKIGDLAPTLKAGLYGEYRTRDYKVRSFNYKWNPQVMPTDFPYGDVVNQILVDANYGSDKLHIYEDTDNRDSYSGDNYLGAGYVGFLLPINKFEIYAGARYEFNQMTLDSYTTLTDFRKSSKDYKDNDIFPSLNVAYRLTDDHVFRGAYGKTVNRPEFREVSRSVYYDFDLFSDVKGNPNLKTAYIDNIDLGYEFYPSAGEVISLTLFYKQFKNPIEWTYLDAGGSYTYTFENADKATNYGLELEIKKRLDFIGLPNFSLNFNGTLIDSEVKFNDSSLETNRAMQGQSPYLVNTGIFYQNDKLQFNGAVMYNRIGKRIIGVGRVDTSAGGSINNDIPDAYEMPRNTIDISLSKRFGKFELKLSANDILSEDLVYKQFPQFIDGNGNLQERTQVTRTYKPGRTFNMSLSYDIN